MRCALSAEGLVSDRTVPERVRDFLNMRAGRFYCDDCIQVRLGLKWRQQVQLITATLGVVTLAFGRQTDRCSMCEERKQVICAFDSVATAKGPKVSGDKPVGQRITLPP